MSREKGVNPLEKCPRPPTVEMSGLGTARRREEFAGRQDPCSPRMRPLLFDWSVPM